jgi:hypothetical protein
MNDNKLTYEQKLEMLKYNISRFDHYYASVNFKSSFLVLGNITILGFLLTSINCINKYILYCHLLLISSSLVFVLLAIKPYLISYNKSNSLIFFNDIANMKDFIFKYRITFLSQEEYLNDLEEQTFILASGLKIKFLYLNISTITFIINIILLFINLAFII